MGVAFIIMSFIFAEAIAFLAYRLFRLNKDLNETSKNLEETTENLNSLAECVLKIAKQSANIEVIEPGKNSDDFTFPNSEGL